MQFEEIADLRLVTVDLEERAADNERWNTKLTIKVSIVPRVATPDESELEIMLTRKLATPRANVISTQGRGLFLKSCHAVLTASGAEIGPVAMTPPLTPCCG